MKTHLASVSLQPVRFRFSRVKNAAGMVDTLKGRMSKVLAAPQSMAAMNPKTSIERPGSGHAHFRASLGFVFFGSQVVMAVVLLLTEVPRIEGDFSLLFLLLGLNFAANLGAIPIYGRTRISPGYIFTLAIIVQFGVPGAVLLAPVTGIAQRLNSRQLDWKLVSSSARFTVVNAASAAAYSLFATVSPDHPRLDMFVGGAAATVACFALSVLLVHVSVMLRTGRSLSSLWEDSRWVAPHYAALGVVGLALASAYIALNVLGVIAFLVPAAMMALAMKQYVDKTSENVAKLEQQNRELQQANVHISNISEELRESYDSTLEALVNALDARDQETKGHSLRVSRYMLDIAREMGVKEGGQEWVDMQRGSLLHDVGKIGVSDSILLKPGKLTPEEWDLMRKHPEIGYNMLRQVRFLEGAADLILSHHERWDGKGYPRGLSHDEIPLGARIFSVVDTFDSMTSDRPYRKALATHDALKEILKYRGSQFDPRVVEAFLDIYEAWVRERDEMRKDLPLFRAA